MSDEASLMELALEDRDDPARDAEPDPLETNRPVVFISLLNN